MLKMIRLFSFMVVMIISGKLYAQTPEEQKAYMEYMSVGPMQQMLAKGVGKWTGTVSMWTKEGQPPMTSTTQTISDTILGGRYVQDVSTGQMWGMSFTGIATTGYDNARKLFVSTWIDNMGTGIMYLEGKWDAATKSLVLKGKSTDPLTGKDMPTREVITFTDETHYTIEMYYSDKILKEHKMMEIKCTKN